MGASHTMIMAIPLGLAIKIVKAIAIRAVYESNCL